MRKQSTVLIVDDEPNIRKILVAALERSGYVCDSAADASEAMEKLSVQSYRVVLSDVLMPGMSGVELLEAIKKKKHDTAVILMTAFGTIEQAVVAMRLGAADYITKPFDLSVVKRIVKQYIGRTQSKATPQPDKASLVFQSAAMRETMELVDRIAPSRATVLITGESGTGKEVVAKELHKRSGRAEKPFIAVHCAALPETLLESELFGYEKGAFTGADQSKPGKFELANGGTLFLDEIGEIPLTMQVKLLRVLQEREVERLGAARPVPIDVRLVAATHRDLSSAVQAGEFREDLYFRLQVLHLPLAPLRERTEDILALAESFLAKYAIENGRNPLVIAEAAARALCSYRWPGNVRELENCIERAVVLAPSSARELTTEMLPKALLNAA